MRLQNIQSDGTFKEFVQIPFQADHEESVLENWLEQNPDSVLEDSQLLIIGRQVRTNFNTFIDLLGVDRQGDVVVIELKRDRTPRDTLAQALEYASFTENLDIDNLEALFHKYSGDESSFSDYHRQYFQLEQDEAISFNKDQRIVIVGQRITPEIRQTSIFLRRKGVRVTCLEFGFFEAEEGQKILSSDIVIGRETTKVKTIDTQASQKITQKEFIESLDDNGLPFFQRLFQFAEERKYLINWGRNGFSMNMELHGAHVALCFGYRPQSVFRQSLYTVLFRTGGLLNKTMASEDVALQLSDKIREIDIVAPAGKESKCVLDRKMKEIEIEALFSWFKDLENTILTHGLAE